MDMFVANINLRSVTRFDIKAGVRFSADELDESTMQTLMTQGHVVQVKPGDPNPPIFIEPSGKKVMAQGLKNETPSAAINPPDTRSSRKPGPEVLTDAQKVMKEAIRTKLENITGTKPPKNCRLDTLKKKLSDAVMNLPPAAALNPAADDTEDTDKTSEAPEASDKDVPDAEASDAPETPTEPATEGTETSKESVPCVWDADPELIKDVPFPQLLSIYKDTCVKYPHLEVIEFTDVEALRAHLSSEFVKPD